MSKSDAMRIPLNEIHGVPGFFSGEAKEAWLRQNNVVLETDWAGRDSVDLPTAWRLKRIYDEQLAKAQKEAQINAEREEHIREAQKARNEMYGRAYARLSRGGVDPNQALLQAQREVLAAEKLPRDVQNRLHFPPNMPLFFD